ARSRGPGRVLFASLARLVRDLAGGGGGREPVGMARARHIPPRDRRAPRQGQSRGCGGGGSTFVPSGAGRLGTRPGGGARRSCAPAAAVRGNAREPFPARVPGSLALLPTRSLARRSRRAHGR